MTLTKILLFLILTTLLTFFIDKYPGEQEKFITHWILISITGATLVFGITWLSSSKKIIVKKLPPIVLAIQLYWSEVFYFINFLHLECVCWQHNFDLKACYDLRIFRLKIYYL